MSLTDEDKQWIAGLLASLETRFDDKLAKLETRFDDKLARLETRFDDKLEKLEVRVSERLEKVETTLLTEFHKWAGPHEMRVASHTAVLRAIDLELESVSQRVRKLEDQRPH